MKARTAIKCLRASIPSLQFLRFTLFLAVLSTIGFIYGQRHGNSFLSYSMPIAPARHFPMNHPPPTAVFASGNKAMNSFLRNWGESLMRLRTKLNFFIYSLDEEGYSDLLSEGRWPLVRRRSMDGVGSLFVANRSAVQSDDYFLMAHQKWAAAAAFLQEGYNVLLSDPDVVFLRDPTPYFSTLPDCDIYPTIDLAEAINYDKMVENGGYRLGPYSNYFNTGFVYFNRSQNVIAFVTFFQKYMVDSWRAGTHTGDQTFFNNLLMNEFELVISSGQSPSDSIGKITADTILAGRCLGYVRKGTNGTSHGDRLAVFPLNQALFPNHPVYWGRKFQHAIIERPFIVHFNWLETSKQKRDAMVAEKMWFMPLSAPVPD